MINMSCIPLEGCLWDGLTSTKLVIIFRLIRNHSKLQNGAYPTLAAYIPTGRSHLGVPLCSFLNVLGEVPKRVSL